MLLSRFWGSDCVLVTIVLLALLFKLVRSQELMSTRQFHWSETSAVKKATGMAGKADLPMDNEMEVEIIAEEINTRMAEINIEGTAGDKLLLPEAAAAFVVLKGWAQLI